MVQYRFLILSLFFILCAGCSNFTAEQAYEEGKTFAESGNKKKAYALFLKSLKKDPKNSMYHIAAGSTAPNQNAAYFHFKNAWENGLKTKTLLLTLLELSFHINIEEKIDYGMKLFEELPDSIKTDSFKGTLYFQFSLYDSALAIWENIQEETPSAELCNNISLAYVRKVEIDTALFKLLECKKNGIINANTYLQLAALFSMKFDYPAVEKLFSEIQNGVYYNSMMKLEHAIFMLAHNKFDQAAQIINNIEKTVSDNQREQILNGIRTIKAYIAYLKNRPEDIDSLLTTITDSTPNGANETELLNAISGCIKNDSTSLELLESARLKNPISPLVDIICARQNSVAKKYDNALAYYTKLPGILQWSPRIIVEIAAVQVLAGKENNALQRISLLHKHGIYTKKSLEIFRDITFKRNLIEKSVAAQKLLEKQYGNDINVRWHGFLLALKEDNTEKAHTIISELLKSAPEDERFIYAKFSIMFLKKEYEKIITELPASSLSPQIKDPLEAKTWLKIGDTSKAISVLERHIQKHDNIQIMTELAGLYIDINNNEKAAKIYKDIIDQSASEIEDSLKTATFLNNYAWTVSSSETGDLEKALGAAKRAYDLAPDNIHIIDTYATILIKSSKYKQCIELLDGKSITKTQGRLLCYLAESYEKTGNLNKARRYYEDALKVDEADQLPLTKSRELIKNHIDELLSLES